MLSSGPYFPSSVSSIVTANLLLITVEVIEECRLKNSLKGQKYVKLVTSRLNLKMHSNFVTVISGCDVSVAAALDAFSGKCTASHSTKSNTFSIWALVRKYVEPALERYLAGLRDIGYPECFGGDSLAKAIKKDAFAVEDHLRLHIRRLLDEDASNAAATLESLLYLVYFCRAHGPQRSVGERALRGAARKAVLPTFDGQHYPYCELCWKLSMHAELDFDQNINKKLSARFCREHDQKNPQSLYRTDHNHRERFHKKLKEIYKELPFQREKWKELAGDTDEGSIRRYAYMYVHSVVVDDRLKVIELAAAGNGNPEIAKVTGLSRQMVHKILTSPLKARYGRTSDGGIIDIRLHDCSL